MKKQKDLIIYQAKSGAIELKGDLKKETIWATRMQMANIFGVNPQAITKHIHNIYKEKELSEKATSSKMELVQMEGKRKVKREVGIYNLEILISVGYRISSKVGTKFRQWATKTLRSHIIDGYTINRSRIKENYETFLKAVENVKALLPKHSIVEGKDILELVKTFAGTWLSLESYDKEKLPSKGMTKKKVEATAEELKSALEDLKQVLIKKKQATSIFGIVIGNNFKNKHYQSFQESLMM